MGYEHPGDAKDLLDTRRAEGLRHLAGPPDDRLRAAQRDRQVDLRAHRPDQGRGRPDRRGDRVPRHRQDHRRVPAVQPDRAGRPPRRRQDLARPQHRASRRHPGQDVGRHLQPRDEQAGDQRAHAVLGRARRLAPAALGRHAAQRGLLQARARGRRAREGADLHRRHRRHQRVRAARQGAPPASRVEPKLGLDHHRLPAAHDGRRQGRQPPAGGRQHLARPQAAGARAQRAGHRRVAAQPRGRDAAPRSGRSSPTCASRAPSSRTPTW